MHTIFSLIFGKPYFDGGDTVRHFRMNHVLLKRNVFVVIVFVVFLKIPVCSLTSYMLWSLYMWHSDIPGHQQQSFVFSSR